MKKLLEKISTRIPKKFPHSSMIVVYAYGCILLMLMSLMLVAWLSKWYVTKTPDIDELIKVFEACTTVTAVAAVTMVVVFNVDKNHDRRPDAAEKQAEKEEPPRPPMGGMRK